MTFSQQTEHHLRIQEATAQFNMKENSSKALNLYWTDPGSCWENSHSLLLHFPCWLIWFRVTVHWFLRPEPQRVLASHRHPVPLCWTQPLIACLAVRGKWPWHKGKFDGQIQWNVFLPLRENSSIPTLFCCGGAAAILQLWGYKTKNGMQSPRKTEQEDGASVGPRRQHWATVQKLQLPSSRFLTCHYQMLVCWTNLSSPVL